MNNTLRRNHPLKVAWSDEAPVAEEVLVLKLACERGRSARRSQCGRRWCALTSEHVGHSRHSTMRVVREASSRRDLLGEDAQRQHKHGKTERQQYEVEKSPTLKWSSMRNGVKFRSAALGRQKGSARALVFRRRGAPRPAASNDRVDSRSDTPPHCCPSSFSSLAGQNRLDDGTGDASGSVGSH